MILVFACFRDDVYRAPRICGDDPMFMVSRSDLLLCSPHLRG